MATLAGLRRRIGSVTSTRQITRAMELVSGARLRRAQQYVRATRPYALKLREMITHISASGDCENPVFAARPVKRAAVVVMTSDKGLCGGFNASILGEARRMVDSAPAGVEMLVVPVGRKCMDEFPPSAIEGAGEMGHRPDPRKAARLARALMAMFQSGEVDQVDILHAGSRSGPPSREPVLPITWACEDWRSAVDYTYEPSADEILAEILPEFVSSSILLAMAESMAAEHAARLSTMASATQNAGDMIRDLKLERNKLRQAAITRELSELVGGAEALSGAGVQNRRARR